MVFAVISKRIQLYRRLLGISQEQLADLVGVSDTYIRKLEAGERLPSLDMLLKLSSTLNTTPDHLLLDTSYIGKGNRAGIQDLLSDCTPHEFYILYENMVKLKSILREKKE